MNWLTTAQTINLAIFMGWGAAIVVANLGYRKHAAMAFWFMGFVVWYCV